MENNLLIGIMIVVVIIGTYFIYQNFSAAPSVINTQQEERQLQIGNPGEKKIDPESEQQENIIPKFCNIDDECELSICGGCFSKEFLKTAPPDLPCSRYEGYSCECINNKCAEIR